MAFPGDYTKYQEVTVQSSQVASDLTDFVVYVNLADLSKAGADIFDTCRSDGGDIRVTKSDGTTQLAREVVTIDTVGKTGELHVKFSGTLSSSSNTVIRIYYNGIDTEPARTDTYGSDNVWTDYDLVVHGETAGEDSSANDWADTANGDLPTTIAGKLAGNAQDFDGTGDYYSMGDQTVFDVDDAGGIDKTIQCWFKSDVTPAALTFLGKWGSSSSQRNWLYRHQSTGEVVMYLGSAGTTGQNVQSSVTVSSGVWAMTHFTWDASTNTGGMFVNGGDKQTTASMTTVSASTATLGIGAAAGSGDSGSAGNWNGQIDEVRIRSSILPDDHIAAEYTNQNTPSTFYTTGDEVDGGGGGGGTPSAPQAVVII